MEKLNLFFCVKFTLEQGICKKESFIEDLSCLLCLLHTGARSIQDRKFYERFEAF